MSDFAKMRTQMEQGAGFIAALDQSGGSTPKALALYGVAPSDYSGDAEMFAEMQKMRARIIESPDFTKSPKEYRKAIFRPERKAKMLDTIRTFLVPLFAIYEYGHLLIDDMSPKTTEKLIEDLRYGGVLARRTDNRMSADQKRILICSTGFLEDTYRVSLLMQRRMIAMGISDAEYAKVKRSRA